LHGCDEVQGYYFSKPLSADNFAERVLSQCN
jgi:EAL domain-containing protein (putative c-di-GMP-specific phosphodiesterase class I)